MLGANSNDDAHGSMIAGADTGADAGTVADTVAVAVTEDLRAVQPPTCPPSN
jgi:hypothetical protein